MAKKVTVKTDTPKVDARVPVRYANAEKTIIDLNIILPGVGSCAHTTQKGEELFNQASSGMFGPVLPWSPPVVISEARPEAIHAEFRRRIEYALQGRSESMMRQAIFLQTLAASGSALTEEQQYEANVFKAVNDWETAMVERRQELIARGDVEAAMQDATWPEPPVLLTAEFLAGF